MMHDVDSDLNNRGNVITQAWRGFQQVSVLGLKIVVLCFEDLNYIKSVL